jgi:hypothetical protein
MIERAPARYDQTTDQPANNLSSVVTASAKRASRSLAELAQVC